MSTRYNNGSHYENHQRAAELENIAAHAHRVGEQHGKQEHLTDRELSRQEREFADGHSHSQSAASFGHAEIAALAHELWKARGCPEGSPDVDWMEAVKQLRTRATTHSSV